VGAFSIAGVPPAAGYLGKLIVFEASTAVESVPATVALVFLVLVGSALSFLYSFQVYQRRFVAPGASGKPSPAAARYLVVLLAALVLVLGLWPQPLMLLSRAAAAALTGGPG
jgi:multicomponent Na+:H+ antiporter subunit D